MTTGKTIALTRRTFVYKVMSLLFNSLSRFVIAFLPRGKRLLISWLLSLSTVIFFSFIFISWRLITLQYCSGFCHTLTWISHGVTCIPHPDPPSHLPLHPIPLGLPSAPGPSTCLMHPTWAGDLFHYMWENSIETCILSIVKQISTVIFEPSKNKVSLSPFFPHLLPWIDGTGYYDLSFFNVVLKVCTNMVASVLSQIVEKAMEKMSL